MATDWFKDTIAAEKQRSQATPADMKWALDKYGTPGYKTVAPNPTLPPLPAGLSYSNWKQRALQEKLDAQKIDMPGAPAGYGPEYASRANQATLGVTPPAAPTPPSGGGGGGGISDIFGPLFQALDQQRANAQSRYTANVGQIENIYGQLIGARSADIGSIEKAYSRLQEAAATRGEGTISGMQEREATRQTQNQAVLQSMGVGDIGSATQDVASEASAAAQDVAALNQSNWAGMLDAMGATSQDIARADITSYGYRQGEDIAKLQGAKEDYLQNIADQEFELKFQQQQAKLAAQQAAAAAQAQAERDAQYQAQKAEEAQLEQLLKYSDPLTQGLIALQGSGVLTPDQAAQTTDAYDTFMRNVFSEKPLSGTSWNAAQAAAAFRTSSAAEGLNSWQKQLIEQAIKASF